ncbi:hypothetical protein BUALT_Bualt01G0058900 [Buddleja alternifolia]|uniref:Uncharacterized protein n=1 Tax=Buddleja alternifolia TaxID=168488 RepID=A0AAV6Y4T9_9LAMI|nr:hypothetical protein BUALT_Bualt01G0058900 [Buddleja alternifolia]
MAFGCDCLKPAVLVTSWTREDPGRRFHGCNEGRCRFSVWEDPPICYRSKIVIPELKNRIVEVLTFDYDDVLHSDKHLSFFLNHLVRGWKRFALSCVLGGFGALGAAAATLELEVAFDGVDDLDCATDCLVELGCLNMIFDLDALQS